MKTHFLTILIAVYPAKPREIAKAFKIGQDQRASLRRLLRDMADRGILLVGNRRAIATSDTLPEVAVLELTDFDDNGDGMAQLAGNEMKTARNPCHS